MNREYWIRFIRSYTEEVVGVLAAANPTSLSETERHVLETRELAFPGASHEELSEREDQLGLAFPRSLREFLQVSNGLVILGFDASDTAILSAAAIDRIGVVSKDSEAAMLATHPSVTEAEYSDRERFGFVRREDVVSTVAITPYADSGIYLLSPRWSDGNGEYEAFAQMFRGTSLRFRSFGELMEVERRRWLKNLRDSLLA
jgi:hypothetical protein